MNVCAILKMYIEKVFDYLFSKKYNEYLIKPHSENMEHYMIYEEKI